MNGGERKRVTLRDVAQTAGVSLKTASNVINGTGRMSADTRAKVQAVIDELGYQVNIAARNLNRDHTGVITLAVPTLTPPYLAELANRVIDAARQRGYSVYVTTYEEGSAEGLYELLHGFNTTVSDGMILSLSEVAQFSPDDLRVPYPLVWVHVTPLVWQTMSRRTTLRLERPRPDICLITGAPVWRWLEPVRIIRMDLTRSAAQSKATRSSACGEFLRSVNVKACRFPRSS